MKILRNARNVIVDMGEDYLTVADGHGRGTFLAMMVEVWILPEGVSRVHVTGPGPAGEPRSWTWDNHANFDLPAWPPETAPRVVVSAVLLAENGG